MAAGLEYGQQVPEEPEAPWLLAPEVCRGQVTAGGGAGTHLGRADKTHTQSHTKVIQKSYKSHTKILQKSYKSHTKVILK